MHSRLSRFMSDGLKESAKLCLYWVPPTWKHGSRYKKWSRFFESAQYWPGDKIREWQFTQLKSILSFAYQNTTGYRELFKQHGVTPDDIRTLADVSFLPFTTKELIRDNLKDFTVSSLTGCYQTTGGSTGIPFGFYEPWYTEEIEEAFLLSAWSSVGWRLGELNAILRGAFVGTADAFFTHDRYRNELLLSSYYLTEKTIHRYIAAVNRFNPRVLQAYPSSVNLLCDLLTEVGRVGDVSFDLILLGSEIIHNWTLKKIDRVFPGARTFGWYGHAERVIMAPWCKSNRQYHLIPFYGHTEILNSGDKEVDEGQEGELVGTSFHMRVTPFIRYRTMDVAVKGAARCDQCGRSFQLMERVVGRNQEIILTKTGRRISMTAMNMHNDVFENVRQFQFCQKKPGEVIFKAIPKESYTEQDATRIRAELMKKLGEDTVLEIVLVEHIPRSPTGKMTFLDQKLPVLQSQ